MTNNLNRGNLPSWYRPIWIKIYETISVAWCKGDVNPVRWQWSYVSFAFSHAICPWHINAKQKWPQFCRRHFLISFPEWKLLYFVSNVSEVSSRGSNWQWIRIGSDDGFVHRYQTIIWTNGGLFHWHIGLYASLLLNELKSWSNNNRFEFCTWIKRTVLTNWNTSMQIHANTEIITTCYTKTSCKCLSKMVGGSYPTKAVALLLGESKAYDVMTHWPLAINNSFQDTQCITMTSQWAWWRLRSPASRLFTQPFIQMQIKENIKAPRHWPLCGEFTGTGEFPTQRASHAEYVSIWWRHHDIFMIINKNDYEQERIPLTTMHVYTQRKHNAIITSLWRQNNVVTSFWRYYDVIIASCAR